MAVDDLVQGTAGLPDVQCLVPLDDGLEGLLVARRLAPAAVDHQLLGALGVAAHEQLDQPPQPGQTARLGAVERAEAAQQLVAQGLAYHDFALPEEVAAEREAAEKETDPELKRRLWEEYRRLRSGNQ